MKDKLEKLLEALSMTKSEFADEYGIHRSTLSEMFSGRVSRLPDPVISRLIIEKNLNATWWHTGTGPILKPFEHQSSDAVKSLALIGKMNRRPKLKKLIDLIVGIEEEYYEQIEAILKTFRK
ncbi:helix-turn-helix transcriptional regulator [Leptospira interrogans]|uniref:Cro/C1-type HTH DNA-binding domain protein n=1 Tax=Leptospira interrogans serovar Australis str. 200703203 TaxID=1085541 RepID=N1ULV4_LEPIR|nr:helix-turn-helix transcriptional regulator [Leptospira interrogans]EMY22775.1 Cro/C1-type HTH DNA-binding domain protein [Leptospira interrogans serovar Australis str. 200703203]UNE66879.1 helix-turn-helix transcriptional regulator [Leptospira interrogans]